MSKAVKVVLLIALLVALAYFCRDGASRAAVRDAVERAQKARK